MTEKISTEESRRISATIVRGFQYIADTWSLSRPERLPLMACPDDRAFEFVVGKAEAGEAFALGDEAISRMISVVRIFQWLERIYYTPTAQEDWLRRDRHEAPFDGRSPLEVMMTGYAGLLQTSEFLEHQATR